MKNILYYLSIIAIIAFSGLLAFLAIPAIAPSPFAAIGLALGILVLNNLAIVAVHNSIRAGKAAF